MASTHLCPLKSVGYRKEPIKKIGIGWKANTILQTGSPEEKHQLSLILTVIGRRDQIDDRRRLADNQNDYGTPAT